MSKSEIWLNSLLTTIVVLGFGIMTYCVFSEYEVQKELIKQSEEYITYNHCNKIQGKYYCKN